MNPIGRCLARATSVVIALGCGGPSAPKSSAEGASGGGAGTGVGLPTAGRGNTSAGGSVGAGDGHGDGGGSAVGSAGSAISSVPAGTSNASDAAKRLGRPATFMIGMGNDLSNDHSQDGAYTLGTRIDLHYAYLYAAYSKSTWSGWNSWNPNGTFVNALTDSADAKGAVPMFTLYAMAANGDGNLSGLSDNGFEQGYWGDVKLLFQRLAAFGKPALVHLEPDFWAYAEQQSKEDPASMKVNVTANAPDCAGLSNDLVGMGHCLVLLARLYAPKVLVGFHASQWANGDPNATVKFLKAVGADQADLVFADLLDRDAGCFEAAVDPNCKRAGSFYWDETNQTSPNFHEYLAWSKAISSGLAKPMIWWQIPFGVPSATRGGTPSHYRDNRVHYIFSHVAEFVAAGGLGVTFGVGAGNQTYIDSDGGQFKAAVAAYYAAPVALP